jgi:hypothetical protein
MHLSRRQQYGLEQLSKLTDAEEEQEQPKQWNSML